MHGLRSYKLPFLPHLCGRGCHWHNEGAGEEPPLHAGASGSDEVDDATPLLHATPKIEKKEFSLCWVDGRDHVSKLELGVSRTPDL